jgi:hypothetical protein
MDAANLRLSPEEMDLVLRSDWILTKNRIQQKAWQLLESLQSSQQALMPRLPHEVAAINPKISKGENYQGLPYLILDQPRYFNKTDVFAIRTMFWWGHFFSTTLHLSGSYKKIYEEKIITSLASLNDDCYICINDDPWQHHFENDNYIPVKELSLQEIQTALQKNSFIKLSSKISLEQWNTAEKKLLAQFEEYITLIGL